MHWLNLVRQAWASAVVGNSKEVDAVGTSRLKYMGDFQASKTML
jgi:hypothetical protein